MLLPNILGLVIAHAVTFGVPHEPKVVLLVLLVRVGKADTISTNKGGSAYAKLLARLFRVWERLSSLSFISDFSIGPRSTASDMGAKLRRMCLPRLVSK